MLYRDPRQKTAGGRTPWKEPLSGPWEVIDTNGNRLKLRKASDKSAEHAARCRDQGSGGGRGAAAEIEAHSEDVVVVPTGARENERPITFEEARDGAGYRSIGESIEAPLERPQGKLEKLKLTVGGYVAYSVGQREEKRCTIGRIWSLDWGA